MATISPSEQLQVDEPFDLISSTTVLGTFYGIAFTFYCLCARALYLQLQDPDRRRQARFTLGYISLVLFCATAFLALNTQVTQLAYINHADYPGGPLGYEYAYNSTISSYQVAACAFELIVEGATVAIQIWRLWIVWSATRYAVAVTTLPLLLFLSCIGLYIPTSIAGGLLPHDQLGISVWTSHAMGIAGYAVVSALTVLVTGLIITRLLLVRRRHIRIMGTPDTSSPYMSIVAMLTESYALESMWSIASAMLIGFGSPGYVLFMTNDSMVKVITYFLVVYRVTSGRGWTKDTERKLTSLQWNHSIQTAADEFDSSYFREPIAMTVMAAVDSPPSPRSESTV